MIKGFTYGWGSRRGMLATSESERSTDRMAALGIDYCALAFAVTQERFSSTRFGFDFRFCNTDREIEKQIESLHRRGIKVCLKPVLNCEDGVWRANISFPEKEFPVYDEHGKKKSYWGEWFSCYTAFICHYAEIAEYTGCEMLCIGCEMVGTEHKEQEWRELIAEVRKLYHGIITYNANHGKEENVRWFDAVDIIGTSAYYPVTDGTANSLDVMLSNWQRPVGYLKKLSEKWGKKILFMEIGCRSAKGCASMPWDFVHRDNPYDEDEQANFYESALISCKDEDWFAGFFWWDWPVFLPDDPHDTGFSIYGKRAEQVLKKYYS
ncbi:MAG: glycosyl hydrolase family 53 [Oscillospiraceae bacterium]|nr:glycosyl hydrolase family 53 [Oscillospiraceae bacterium]